MFIFLKERLSINIDLEMLSMLKEQTKLLNIGMGIYLLDNQKSKEFKNKVFEINKHIKAVDDILDELTLIIKRRE